MPEVGQRHLISSPFIRRSPSSLSGARTSSSWIRKSIKIERIEMTVPALSNNNNDSSLNGLVCHTVRRSRCGPANHGHHVCTQHVDLSHTLLVQATCDTGPHIVDRSQAYSDILRGGACIATVRRLADAGIAASNWQQKYQQHHLEIQQQAVLCRVDIVRLSLCIPHYRLDFLCRDGHILLVLVLWQSHFILMHQPALYLLTPLGSHVLRCACEVQLQVTTLVVPGCGAERSAAMRHIKRSAASRAVLNFGILWHVMDGHHGWHASICPS